MRRIVLIAAAAFALACGFVPTGRAATPKPVPSLTPAATHHLWEQLVNRKRSLQVTADCRPARAIFYAATDWLRLATNLAQNASPCAQYYVSVPPLAGDKAQPRPNQAAQIRALGTNVHALAEINFTGWTRWVSQNNSDWFTAGVTARQRMAAAGYDVAAGDTWAMNEVSTAVRRNTGSARRNLEEFLRGLYDGGGNPVKGVVFIVGQNQGGDQSTYKSTLQSWLQDSTFWDTVGQYVSDWMQETYGDLRTYAVQGASPQQRRDALVQYLGHPMALANAGGDLTPSARAFMVAGYGPLANAAWRYQTAYGWTDVESDQMQDFISAQAYAERALDAQAGLASDRFGFAWAPNNAQKLTVNDFTRQTNALLQRLGQAVRDSGETSFDPNDPGVGACQPSFCTTVVPGAAFTDQWAGFSIWTSTGVAFAGQPPTITAGTTLGPVAVQLKTGGILTPAMADTPITLTTTSTKGQFATSPNGPWTRSLVVTIPAGQTGANIYYQDTVAGTPTLTATQAGQPPATLVVTVNAAAPASVKVEPRFTTIVGGQKKLFAAQVEDQFGNPSTAAATWSLTPASLGAIKPTSGASTTLTASKTVAGRGKLTITVGSLSDTVIVKIERPPAKIAGTFVRHVNGYLVVTVVATRAGVRTKGVPVSVIVRRGTGLVARVTGRTDAHGRFIWRSKHQLPSGHYTAKAAVR